MSAARDAIVETIGAASLRLDEDDFEAFLALCAPDFHYQIQAFSPEIRREMTWLDLDRAELETLFRTLPRHNSDHAPLTRHVTVAKVSLDETAATASAVSSLQVFRTALDGGATALLRLASSTTSWPGTARGRRCGAGWCG